MDLSYENVKSGQIGHIYYYEERILPMSDEQRQQIIDQDSRAAMYALIQSASLNPNQGYVDVQAEYEKARMKGRERSEGLQKQQVPMRTMIQVGQKESNEELQEIERKPNFRGWFDPDLISYLLTFQTIDYND